MTEEIKRRYYHNGNIEIQEYLINNQLNRIDGPAEIWYYEKDGNIKVEGYWVGGKLHRIDGPAIIEYFENGNVYMEGYWIDGNESPELKDWLLEYNPDNIPYSKWTDEMKVLLRLSL